MKSICMNKQLHRILVLIGTLALACAAGAQTPVAVYCEARAPTQFAAAELQTVLNGSEHTVTGIQDISHWIRGEPETRVLLLALGNQGMERAFERAGGLAVGPLTTQAYALRRTGSAEHPTYWVFGGGTAGVMYGGLRLAEIVRHGGLGEFEPEQDTPYISRRGIKFNIPLDARTPAFVCRRRQQCRYAPVDCLGPGLLEGVAG